MPRRNAVKTNKTKLEFEAAMETKIDENIRYEAQHCANTDE